MYYSKEIIEKIKEIDLLTYLRNNDPNELVHFSNQTYITKTHDSLKISNGMWYWFSRGIGGKTALEYLIKVKELSFIKAVGILVGKVNTFPTFSNEKQKTDRFELPLKSDIYDNVKNYLISRGIDKDIIQECIDNDLIYEEDKSKNVVFVGYDENNNPRYAGCRGITQNRFMKESKGSDKKFSFKLLSKETNTNVHLFESAIDLLSYATLLKDKGSKWYDENLISLAGVYKTTNNKLPKTIENYLDMNKHIKKIYIHFDNDSVGKDASYTLKKLLENKYEIIDNPPPVGKDVNDFLMYSKNKSSYKDTCYCLSKH